MQAIYNSMRKKEYLTLAGIQWVSSLIPTRQLHCVNLRQSHEGWCKGMVYPCQEIMLIDSQLTVWLKGGKIMLQ